MFKVGDKVKLKSSIDLNSNTTHGRGFSPDSETILENVEYEVLGVEINNEDECINIQPFPPFGDIKKYSAYFFELA